MLRNIRMIPRPVSVGRFFDVENLQKIHFVSPAVQRREPFALPPLHPEERGHMDSRILRGLDRLLDRYIMACLFLSLIILTWVGVGNTAAVSAAGLLLCAAGMGQPAERADMKFFLPLALYNLVSMVSAYAAYGNITDGYASTQMIFLMAALSGEEAQLLRRLCVLWTGAAAAACVVQFVFQAVAEGSPRRAEGFLSNPNAMGIFLVLGWFALMR